MQPQSPPVQAPSQPYPVQHHQPWGPTFAPPTPASPRGVTIGIAVELFGIAVALVGVASGTLYFSGGGPVYQPNVGISALGGLIAMIGLVLHIARV